MFSQLIDPLVITNAVKLSKVLFLFLFHSFFEI